MTRKMWTKRVHVYFSIITNDITVGKRSCFNCRKTPCCSAFSWEWNVYFNRNAQTLKFSLISEGLCKIQKITVRMCETYMSRPPKWASYKKTNALLFKLLPVFFTLADDLKLVTYAYDKTDIFYICYSIFFLFSFN